MTEEWKTYSLVNIASQEGEFVTGSWIQDKIGTLEMAIQAARQTEEANGHRITVAVVNKCGGSVPFSSLPPKMQRLDCACMKRIDCSCGGPEMGFDCICEWLINHPGCTEYSCEFCGPYCASEPRCNKCEKIS
jgi:hypothetical protein